MGCQSFKSGLAGRGVYTLSTEQPSDWWEVEALYDTCFAPGRDMLSSYRLRDGVDPVRDLCLVARDEDGILGAAIRYWPVQIGTASALLLGPVAVHPTRQGEGLGALVIGESLGRAHQIGWERVMLVGDAPYYSRFGFTKLSGMRMPPPTNPERILGLSLNDTDAWTGISGPVTNWSQP